jgi:DNA polymerase-3 subunit gamma/tau
MSYKVLARKWRPTKFSEVVGQEHVLKSLISALDNDRVHHAYLLTGTRGVGKTTLARILARCLNCESGVGSEPCGQCSACKEIDEGRYVDLIEVDAASRTKVEDTRDLLDNVQYLPARARYKVYLIDEVHMLSTHSFNALLKTLEEPPEHVKFLFATTDPQKLPVTVLSRCLQFNLKNLAPAEIADYLAEVLDKESVEFEKKAVWQLAIAANGSMRDGLTLTDQAITHCNDKFTEQNVSEMLGVPTSEQIVVLLGAMARRNIKEVLLIIQKIEEKSVDYINYLDNLLAAFHQIMLAQVDGEFINKNGVNASEFKELAKLFSAEDVQLYYQFGLKGRNEMSMASSVRSAFEMLILRMLLFSPAYSESSEDPDEDSVNQKKKITSEAACSPDESEQLVGAEVTSIPLASGQRSADNQSLSVETWNDIFLRLNLSGVAQKVFANVEYRGVEDEKEVFCLDRSQSAIYNDDLLEKFKNALQDFFGYEVYLEMLVSEVKNETPAGLKKRLADEANALRVASYESDHNVQDLVNKFSGVVLKDSIVKIRDR